jgi:DNA-binding MarR family transcriptional regulator
MKGNRLEKAGLVTREEASEDRRGVYVVLTTEGAVRFEKAIKVHVAFVRENFLSKFNDKELNQLSVFWRRFENQE